MPTGHPSPSGTITAPTFSRCMVRIASATLDLARTVTTRWPLVASTSFRFMDASCVAALWPLYGWRSLDLNDVKLDFALADVLRREGRAHVIDFHLAGLVHHVFLLAVGVGALQRAALQIAVDADRRRRHRGVFRAGRERDLVGAGLGVFCQNLGGGFRRALVGLLVLP